MPRESPAPASGGAPTAPTVAAGAAGRIRARPPRKARVSPTVARSRRWVSAAAIRIHATPVNAARTSEERAEREHVEVTEC